MFRSFARNVAITGFAYALISVVGLLLAPVLIAAYGLAGYGQILLARVFLPNASFGFLDMGLGENTTRAIAAGEGDRDRERSGRALSLLLVEALAIGSLTAVLLVLCAGALPGWLSVEPEQRGHFTQLMYVTAALQPALFLTLVAEGVLKGRNQFRRLRSCEVTSALIYAGLALVAVQLKAGYHWVAAALLAGLAARTAMTAIFAVAALKSGGIRPRRWDRASRTEILGWSRTMFFNKVLGTLQTQAASPLLGFLAGPASVGLFDAVVRLPRFFKSVFSLVTTPILPLATQLHAANDRSATTRFGTVGVLGAFALCAPPTVMAMALSQPILAHWLGPELAPHWSWQSAMFLVPLLNVAISFGGTMLLADRAMLGELNRLTAVQVVLQLAISLLLLDRLTPWSFVLGQVASMLAVTPFQLALIARGLGLGKRIFARLAALLGIAALPAVASRLVVVDPGPVLLVVLIVVGCLASWAAAPWLVLEQVERRALRRMVDAKLAVAVPWQTGYRRAASEPGEAADRSIRDRPQPSRAPERTSMNLAQRLMWQVNRSPLRHAVKRVWRIAASADLARRRQLLAELATTPEIDAAASAIAENGYAQVDGLLEPGSGPSLLAATEAAQEASGGDGPSVFGGGRKTLWTHVVERVMRDGRLDADTAFARFAMQPQVVAAVGRVLGGVPRLDYVTVTHSLPTAGPPAFSQLWHRDYDDVRVLKLFVYLTDVDDERDGPFTFIPAPLSRRFGYRLRSHLSDETVTKRIDLARDSVRLFGPRLSAFIVDTGRCLHMGSRVAPGHERLMYTATYFLPPRIFPEPATPFFRPTGSEGPLERKLLIP